MITVLLGTGTGAWEQTDRNLLLLPSHQVPLDIEDVQRLSLQHTVRNDGRQPYQVHLLMHTVAQNV